MWPTFSTSKLNNSIVSLNQIEEVLNWWEFVELKCGERNTKRMTMITSTRKCFIKLFIQLTPSQPISFYWKWIFIENQIKSDDINHVVIQNLNKLIKVAD